MTNHVPHNASEYASDDRLDTLHEVLLMMLQDFAQICTDHDLPWIASYGTAIGALRHNGFIPWDDDVDICMLREDLETFISVIQQSNSDKYEVINTQINPKYPMMTSRLMLKGTEFRDNALMSAHFPSGIFLDLFPLDNISDNETHFKRQAWRSWLYNKFAIAKLIDHPCIVATGLRGKILHAGTVVMHAILNCPPVRSIDFSHLSYAWHTRYNIQQTRRVGFMCDTNRFWSIYDRDDLFPVRMVPFETIEVPIAHNAEKLLIDLYGDYLTPPPVEERTVHYPDVLDFGPYAPAARQGSQQQAAENEDSSR